MSLTLDHTAPAGAAASTGMFWITRSPPSTRSCGAATLSRCLRGDQGRGGARHAERREQAASRAARSQGAPATAAASSPAATYMTF